LFFERATVQENEADQIISIVFYGWQKYGRSYNSVITGTEITAVIGSDKTTN